jgi:hypothetical protein
MGTTLRTRSQCREALSLLFLVRDGQNMVVVMLLSCTIRYSRLHYSPVRTFDCQVTFSEKKYFVMIVVDAFGLQPSQRSKLLSALSYNP